MKDLPFAAGVLETLASYGSATVQNAGIVVRGFVPEGDDYTGPTLYCYAPGRQRAVVGFAFTAKMTPLHEQQNVVGWEVYYAALADRTVPTIVVIEDADEPAGRAASMGDMMAHHVVAGERFAVVVEASNIFPIFQYIEHAPFTALGERSTIYRGDLVVT